MDKCFYCGSANLIKDLQPKVDHQLGIYYYMSQKGPFGTRLGKVEPVFCELCQDCGSVRLYMKELQRDWVR